MECYHRRWSLWSRCAKEVGEWTLRVCCQCCRHLSVAALIPLRLGSPVTMCLLEGWTRRDRHHCRSLSRPHLHCQFLFLFKCDNPNYGLRKNHLHHWWCHCYMCTITTYDVIVICVLSPLQPWICIVCHLAMKLNSQTLEIPNISLQLQNKNANQILKWNWTRSLTLPMTLPFDVQTVFHADANRFVVLL